VNEENARRFSELWGHSLTARPGLSAPEMLDAATRGELDLFYIAGGNFVETMPDPERMRAALERVPCRVHQDLFVNSSMLVEPGEQTNDAWVLLLPGQTRYEQKGGGTLTSTERRIRFSPEIPGPRIGEAMAEWEIFARAGQAALAPDKEPLLEYSDTAAIRTEMERCMPLYQGIAGLRAEGDSVQYGGPLLCAGGVCANMPGGHARFTPLTPPQLEERDAARGTRYYLATRRGKQFNSMVWSEADHIVGTTRRDAVLVSPEDAARLGVRHGDRIVLRAGTLNPGVREFRGVCHLAPVKPGTLQAYWPECNVLLPNRLDPQSKEPDYNAWVTLEKLSP
jgi:predicted molibdopterin-dependent oxidoreductase YjgC